ncbi:hypothetical protein B0J18DRAFT_464754 [Chaetomium sp. MPI-SDFR-AT-0129]|nr:hypothetical protein B0J18DRAFT_464754 [Chaetomium sp. MPI-SDFR-AT-0129]
MTGLASSRHAPPFPRSTRHGGGQQHNANFVVTPAPIASSARATTSAPPITRSSPTKHPTDDNDDAPPRSPHFLPHPPNRRRRPSASTSAAHELARYTKIVRRLKWKLPFLAQGYRQAVDRLGVDPHVVTEAELMFKLDFFEYYMLIERALVHLLGVFGVEVSPSSRGRSTRAEEEEEELAATYDKNENNKLNTTNGSAPLTEKGLRASVWRGDGRGPRQHRYHANVLAALDREDSPLRGTLGSGEVRLQLRRAKDLRNRWKTAADDEEEQAGQEEELGQRNQSDTGDVERSRSLGRFGEPPAAMDSGNTLESEKGQGRGKSWWSRKRAAAAAPLDSYRLEHMLEVIFLGFDEAFLVAEAHVRGSGAGGGDADVVGEDEMAMDWTAIGDEEEQWEFMVDAMDWEAV